MISVAKSVVYMQQEAWDVTSNNAYWRWQIHHLPLCTRSQLNWIQTCSLYNRCCPSQECFIIIKPIFITSLSPCSAILLSNRRFPSNRHLSVRELFLQQWGNKAPVLYSSTTSRLKRQIISYHKVKVCSVSMGTPRGNPNVHTEITLLICPYVNCDSTCDSLSKSLLAYTGISTSGSSCRADQSHFLSWLFSLRSGVCRCLS